MPTIARLWPASPPTGLTAGSVQTDRYNRANAFTPAATGYLYSMRWYRGATGSSIAPDRLALWDTTTQSEVWFTTAPDDDGTVGWQETLVGQNVLLVAGRTYRASACWPTGTTHYYTTTLATPESPLAFTATPRYYNASACAYPNSTSGSTDYAPADATWTDTPPTEVPPATPADVADQLADWLDTSDGTQAHSAPLLTYQAVTDGDTGLPAIAASIGDAIGAGWDSATDTLHQIGSKVGSILTKVTDGPLPGIAGLEDLANTIIANLEAAANYLINPTGGGAGALANNPPLPGAGWAMVGEADFDDCDTITVQCHLIVLDFSTFPVSRPAHNVCGVPIRYRLGWWCPMNGDFASHRQFIDFEKMHVQDGGRLMNGALIVCEPGTSGHWQAWLLS